MSDVGLVLWIVFAIVFVFRLRDFGKFLRERRSAEKEVALGLGLVMTLVVISLFSIFCAVVGIAALVGAGEIIMSAFGSLTIGSLAIYLFV